MTSDLAAKGTRHPLYKCILLPILLKEQQLGVQSREHSAKEAMSTDPARQDPKFPLSHQQQNT